VSADETATAGDRDVNGYLATVSRIRSGIGKTTVIVQYEEADLPSGLGPLADVLRGFPSSAGYSFGSHEDHDCSVGWIEIRWQEDRTLADDKAEMDAKEAVVARRRAQYEALRSEFEETP
jgi:hypothetical protein